MPDILSDINRSIIDGAIAVYIGPNCVEVQAADGEVLVPTSSVSVAPVIISTATISGGPEIGSIVGGPASTFSGTPAPVVTHSWYKDGVIVNGEDSLTIDTSNYEDGEYQRRDTARNSAGSVVVTTNTVQIEAGPIYPAQTPAGTLLQIGHSSLNETAPQLQAFWPGGSVITDMGSDSNSTVTVWDGNGPARNGTYDFVVLTEMDLISPDTYWVFPPPGSAEGIERLQHQYWLLQEADDRGAPFAFYLQARLQGQAPTEVQSNAEIARYYCWWLMQHSGRQIPLIDADQIVERMLAAGVPTAEIYRDPSHFEPRARSAFAAAQYMVFAKQLPAGYAATDPIGAEAVMTTLQSDWWAGFGGTERRAMWAGADPLPSPDPRPGAALSLTSDAYEGPALSGNAPTVSGTVMTFDGNGQWAPDNLPLGAQKYICAAIRFPVVAADASLLFASSDATSLFANPQIAIETSGGLWRAVYYDDPDVMFVVSTGTAATTSWTILELWTDGTTLGISIDGAADVTGTLPGPAPDTDSLRLFWTGGAIEAVQVTARNTVPDATERASIRAAASARVP